MKLTESIRAAALQALRKKKQSRTWLSEQMGLHRSWATRFFDGSLKTLSDDHLLQLQEILDVQFFTLERKGKLSKVARQVAEEVDSNEAFAEVATALRSAMKDKIYTPRYVPTKDMSKLGNEIIRICYANEDKPGKVARLVLELLA